MTETICWGCDKAYGQCSWSKSFTPVEGWEAERRDVKIAVYGYVESYIVTACPLFEKDGEKDELCEVGRCQEGVSVPQETQDVCP